MKLKFSKEDIRILQECNKESFYNRCLPISGLFGFATYSAIKAGLSGESFYFTIEMRDFSIFLSAIDKIVKCRSSKYIDRSTRQLFKYRVLMYIDICVF